MSSVVNWMNSDEVSIGATESDVCRRNTSVGLKLQNTVGLKTLFGIHNIVSLAQKSNSKAIVLLSIIKICLVPFRDLPEDRRSDDVTT